MTAAAVAGPAVPPETDARSIAPRGGKKNMRPYRKQKISSLIQQVVSEGVAFKLNDPRVSPLTTVTRVEMTPDLLIARVYLTVPGDASAERRTLQAIRHAGGYLQRMVAQALTMRQCPELRFEIDETSKAVRRTMEILAENRRNDPELAAADAEENSDATDAAFDEAPGESARDR